MTTESTAINYKIGNERLISVTEKAARKLESLLEQKGQPDGALRLAVVGGGCHGSGGWPEGARYSRADLKCPAGYRSQERAFCQRLSARLQRRPAKRRLQGHESKRRRALLLRGKFRGLTGK